MKPAFEPSIENVAAPMHVVSIDGREAVSVRDEGRFDTLSLHDASVPDGPHPTFITALQQHLP